jgi:hypothetical protein
MTLLSRVSCCLCFGFEVLFGYLGVCGHSTYFRDLYFDMVSRLCVSNTYYETLDFGYAFSLRACFGYFNFIFFPHLNRATLKAFTVATPSLITATLSSTITQIIFLFLNL